MKVCRQCQRELPVGAFYARRDESGAPTRLRNECKECIRVASRRYDAACRRLGVKAYAKVGSQR